MKKNNLIKLIRIWGILFLVGPGAILVIIDAIRSYSDLNSRAIQIQADYIDNQKKTIKQEVSRVVDLIRNEKEQSENLTRRKIKSRIYEAYSIAQNIYQQNQATESKTKIQQMILDALRPIRFENGSGYYFATRMDGVEVLFADKPEMEGLNLLDIKDTHGKHVIKDMIEIVKKSGEGFYEYQWTKPESAGKDFKKISYIKLFEPYDLFIGTGLYVVDVEDGIKENLLSTISRIRFGKEGYIFVNNLNGDTLVSNGKIFDGTKKLWEVFSDDPVKMKDIFEKEYNAALKPEGDYIYYSWIKLTNSDKESQKTSFVYGMPDLQWLVGAGVYLDDIETDIALMQDELNNKIKTRIVQYVLIVVGICGLFLVFFDLLNRKLMKDINLFISFFGGAAYSDQEIERDKIGFVELDQMAEYANEMLAERKQAEETLRESEAKFRFIAENMADIISTLDMNLHFTYISPGVKRLRGYTVEEAMEHTFDKIFTPESMQIVLSTFEDEMLLEASGKADPGRTRILELEEYKKDGSIVWVEVNVTFLRSENNTAIGILSVDRDITERRQAEEALRESEARFKALHDASFGGIAIHDKGVILDCNQGLSEMTGYHVTDLIGMDGLLLIAEKSRTAVMNNILSGYEKPYEAFGLRKNGEEFPMRLEARNVPFKGKTVRTVEFRDITEQKLAEKALRESEEKYRVLFDTFPLGITVSDPSGKIVETNATAAKLLGVHKEEHEARHVDGEEWRIIHPDGTPMHTDEYASVRALKENRRIENVEMGIVKPDAEITWISVTAAPLLLEKYGVVVTYGDITAHKRAEQNYQTLFREMLDGFALHEIICDARGRPVDYRFLDVNPAFEHMTGLKAASIVGRTVMEVMPEIEQHWIETYGKVALTGEPAFFENYSADLKKHFEITVFQPAVNQFACIFADITDRQKAKEEKARLDVQLQQALKMESIGSLAGGIAHDLNNILFPISGLSEMLLDQMPAGTPEYESIEQIHKSAQRGSDLVKQILSFSRQSNPQKLPIRIQPILKEVLKLARATIPMNIDIIGHIKPDCGMVSADPTQIHQIAMNLITNAYHAVAENGGSINIGLKETAVGPFDEKEALPFHAMPGDLLAGRYACITVSDTGTGIDQTLIDKIFDPYFTTKELGRGTGLGLSVVHGIVKEHGGDIRVYSEVGKGTVFHVYLPLLADVKDIKTAAITRKYPTGHERILLVDDEEPIAKMVQMMLERLGYKVTTRTSSPDALEAFKIKPSEYDLVISDRGMPNMTGEQLARELLSIRSGIPIILCTGFSDEKDERHAIDLGVKGFLKKPVATGDLAEKVRNVLDDVKKSSSQ